MGSLQEQVSSCLEKGSKGPTHKEVNESIIPRCVDRTTVSHISDIVGSQGIVFAVEPAIRVARELIENVASRRGNVVPIIEDARKPYSYFSIFGKVDVVYSDIAQSDQTDIAIANCHAYLKKGGTVLVVIKTRSIDVTMEPKSVVAREARRLQEGDSISIKQLTLIHSIRTIV
jgi:fibrillarin-like pre-rRNA processing protein